MLSQLLISVLVLLSRFVSAVPLTGALEKRAMGEDIPLQVKNIVLFEANEGTGYKNLISLQVSDPNKGYELDTMCSRTVEPGQSLVDDETTYNHCTDENVDFSFRDTELVIRRYWRSSDGTLITGYAPKKLDLTEFKIEYGTIRFQNGPLDFAITSMVA